MPIVINGLDGNPMTSRDVDASPNNFVFSASKLAFSGVYPTGGDTLDLSTLAQFIPSAGFLNAFADGNGVAAAFSAGGGYYQVVAPAGGALNGFKLKIFSAGGAELANAGYPASIATSDNVVLQALWRKLIA